MEETFGLVDTNWDHLRNSTLQDKLQLVQQMTQGIYGAFQYSLCCNGTCKLAQKPELLNKIGYVSIITLVAFRCTLTYPTVVLRGLLLTSTFLFVQIQIQNGRRTT